MSASPGTRRLDGRAALITGAGTGIGRALALVYAREGARLVIGARRREPLDETAALVCEAGGECTVVPADVSSEADCRMLVARTVEKLGGLDVLVNNAGAPGTDQPVAEMDLENWNRTIAINVTGPMLLAREALRTAMLPARRGSIQFFSSAAAKRVRPGKAHYAVAKMGLIPLAQTLAREVGPQGIRVNTIVIGLVAGDLVDAWIARVAGDRSVEEVRAAMVADIPLRRALDPSEIAEVSLFLASDQASGVTGHDIHVTAGRRASMSDQTVEARLAALEGRVHVLEDELAIHHLIVTYGFAVDAGDAESTGAALRRGRRLRHRRRSNPRRARRSSRDGARTEPSIAAAELRAHDRARGGRGGRRSRRGDGLLAYLSTATAAPFARRLGAQVHRERRGPPRRPERAARRVRALAAQLQSLRARAARESLADRPSHDPPARSRRGARHPRACARGSLAPQPSVPRYAARIAAESPGRLARDLSGTR